MSIYASTAEDIIHTSLANYVGHQKSTSTGIMLLCPFHDDRSPSFGINLSSDNGIPLGYGHCLGCGKNASWNEIADKLGFTKIKKSDTKITSYKQRKREHLLKGGLNIKDLIKEFRCSEYLPKWPADKEWRTINGSLMNKFAYRAFNTELFLEYAILPVTIDGDLKGAIKAVTKKTGDAKELSYVTSKANDKSSWVKKFGLFPYDVVQDLLKESGMRTVVLCEGPRDSLTVIQETGIPSLSILGCRTWSPAKMKLLLSLPIDRVVLCMDGDKAGKDASDEIFLTLAKKTDVKVFDLFCLAQKLELKKLDPCMVFRKKKYQRELRELIV